MVPDTLNDTEDADTVKPDEQRAAEEADAEGDAPTPPLEPEDDAGATRFASSGDFHDTLPFRAGESASKVTVEGWTVEHYASLCVELERGARETVLARYRIDEAKRQALERQWNDKFSTSTRLARLFLKARAQYIEWLKLQK